MFRVKLLHTNSRNSLKPKLVYMIFKNSSRISKRAQHFSITKSNWLMMFSDGVAVYDVNYRNPINIKGTFAGC